MLFILPTIIPSWNYRPPLLLSFHSRNSQSLLLFIHTSYFQSVLEILFSFLIHPSSLLSSYSYSITEISLSSLIRLSLILLFNPMRYHSLLLFIYLSYSYSILEISFSPLIHLYLILFFHPRDIILFSYSSISHTLIPF